MAWLIGARGDGCESVAARAVGFLFFCRSGFSRDISLTGECLSRLKPLLQKCCCADQSPSVSSDALPPAAVVLTVTTFSVAKRSR